MTSCPPDESWLPVEKGGAFTAHSGRFWYRPEREDCGAWRFGFRVEPHHCNLRPTCHGGMLATFADIVMARAVLLMGVASPLPTVSMTLDYLSAAPLGGWVEARVVVPQVTGKLAFVSALSSCEEVPVIRASAVYRHGGKAGEYRAG